jgi:hypothetical protein
MSLLMRLLHLQASVKWIGNIEKKRPPFWCLELNISMLSEWMQQSSSNREKNAYSVVRSYTHTMLVPKRQRSHCGSTLIPPIAQMFSTATQPSPSHLIAPNTC